MNARAARQKSVTSMLLAGVVSMIQLQPWFCMRWSMPKGAVFVHFSKLAIAKLGVIITTPRADGYALGLAVLG